jgi:hypothetical protein
MGSSASEGASKDIKTIKTFRCVNGNCQDLFKGEGIQKKSAYKLAFKPFKTIFTDRSKVFKTKEYF